MININELISKATLDRSPALLVYRLIKTEFLRWVKDNPGKNFDESVEAKILKKMYAQRIEAEKIYREAGRIDLADSEALEASYILPFLPREIPESEIEDYTKQVIVNNFNNSVTMKDMKAILTLVQMKYPSASGKIISNIVKSYC